MSTGERGVHTKQSGMTLIELLVVITIIGVLASIALPSYRTYVLRANRSDAKTKLLWAAGALERCYTRNNSYKTDLPGCSVTLPVTSENGHYQITGVIPDGGQTFELTATPQNAQAKDKDCANFVLDNFNTRKVSGTKTGPECWSK